MKIDKILYFTGIILVILGIAGGIIRATNIDKENYDVAKEVFDDLYDNEFAEASYNSAKNMYLQEGSTVLKATIGTIIGGLLVSGLGQM